MSYQLSKKSGFTLIETLIAAAIAVVMLGASVTASRVLTDTSSASSEAVEMNALANEGIENIRSLYRSLPASTDLGVPLHLAVDNNTNQTIYGAFISVPITNRTCNANASNGFCFNTDQGGPARMVWCDSTVLVSDSTCANTTMPVRPPGIACNNNCKLTNIFTYLQSKDPEMAGGDVIAIRNTPYTTGASNTNRVIVDLHTLPSGGGQTVDANVAAASNWSFYSRSIKVTRFAHHQGQFLLDQVSGGGRASDMKAEMYLVRVRVRNLINLRSMAEKTIVISDWN